MSDAWRILQEQDSASAAPGSFAYAPLTLQQVRQTQEPAEEEPPSLDVAAGAAVPPAAEKIAATPASAVDTHDPAETREAALELPAEKPVIVPAHRVEDTAATTTMEEQKPSPAPAAAAEPAPAEEAPTAASAGPVKETATAAPATTKADSSISPPPLPPDPNNIATAASTMEEAPAAAAAAAIASAPVEETAATAAPATAKADSNPPPLPPAPNNTFTTSSTSKERMLVLRSIQFDEDPETRYPAFTRHYTNNKKVNNERQNCCWAVDTLTTTTAQEAESSSSSLKPVLVPNPTAVARATVAIQERLAMAARQRQLLRLVWRAVLEECQAAWYSWRQLQQQQQQSKASTSTMMTGYSTTAPTSRSGKASASASSDDPSSDSWFALSTVAFTPSALVQRVKHGCAAAWQREQPAHYYHNTYSQPTLQQQQQHQPTTTLSGRRSRRVVLADSQPAATRSSQSQPPSLPQPSPTDSWKVKPGGRVALALLEVEGKEEESKVDNDDQEVLPAAPVADASDKAEEGGDVEMLDAEQNGNGDNGGDEPYDDGGDEEEEDEEENEESNAEEEDEEEDEDEVLVLQNPYLEPTRLALLEWVGRKLSKSLSTLDIQPLFAESMVHLETTQKKKKRKKKKRSLEEMGIPVDEIMTHTDRLVWSQLLLQNNTLWPVFSGPDANLQQVTDFLFADKQARIVLQPLSAVVDEDDADLGEWDLGAFGRTQFTVRLVNPVAAATLVEQRAQWAAERHAQEKEQKIWENYRWKGIHSGYCQWGEQNSWIEVAAAALPSSGSSNNNNGGDDDLDQSSIAAVAEQPASSSLSLSDDLALAQTLGAASGRRKTRRAGGDGSVFYGNQGNMTAKQLMDALLRLISGASLSSQKKSFQSMMGLLHAVPDESSDPLRRIRTALGRLVWKRNQLARLEVHMEWSDARIWNKLRQGPLWQLPTAATTKSGVVNGSSMEETVSSPPQGGGDGSAVIGDIQSDEEALVRYVRTLHQTELQLRGLVMANISEFPLAFIATAADERAGTMEAMDNIYFEDASTIQWLSSGHELLGSRILRPAGAQETNENSLCYWFEIPAYVPSVATSPNAEDASNPPERVSIGRAKEPTAVERRMRFLANPVGNGPGNSQPALILTEGQVRAGIKAAEMDQSKSEFPETRDNPFASGNPEICLFGPGESTPVTADVVGHDCVVASMDNRIQHKILVLPKTGSSREGAFWATLDLSSSSGAISCTADEDGKFYTIQQFDFHASSPAYQECLAIITFLQRHPKGSVFLEPVDPAALGIPEYFDIIKNPMDVSTLLKKLERGDYANVPPSQMKGQPPVVRMLNGPFRNDVELIFDNAVLFNPPDDWIHQAAVSIKKAVIKKIEQASSSAERRVVQQRKQKSLYVDYDSDVDMYVYESDDEDEYGGTSKRKRKRKGGGGAASAAGGGTGRAPAKEDSALRATERGIRLQKVLSDSLGLRGPFAKLPIATIAWDFSLPPEWSCRRKQAISEQKVSAGGVADSRKKEAADVALPELDELIALHRQVEESEHVGVRRSTRAHDYDQETRDEAAAGVKDVEYFCSAFSPSSQVDSSSSLPKNRLEVELNRERMHETHFAKLYHQKYKGTLKNNNGSLDVMGYYSEGFFPPYLGRVVPLMSPYSTSDKTTWEIREQFVVPALRWVLRGLIQSDHLTELEPLDSASGGVVLPNHLYFIDESQTPFDILDTKEFTRRKRADAEEESSEDEVELSEYEKARAERVARNKERLQALGLA